MSIASDRLVWIDCEMTGLDLENDELVEIAIVVTDYELNIVDPGLDLVIKPSDKSLEQMGEFVRNMHSESGLINEIPSGLTLTEAEHTSLEYLVTLVPEGQRPALAGNTIGTDRAFLTKFMPLLDARLHYRSVDVSSIKELARRWYPRTYFNAPVKNGGHRALADILESIRELDYYRRAVFVDAPGPTSVQAKTIADSVVTTFGRGM